MNVVKQEVAAPNEGSVTKSSQSNESGESKIENVTTRNPTPNDEKSSPPVMRKLCLIHRKSVTTNDGVTGIPIGTEIKLYDDGTATGGGHSFPVAPSDYSDDPAAVAAAVKADQQVAVRVVPVIAKTPSPVAVPSPTPVASIATPTPQWGSSLDQRPQEIKRGHYEGHAGGRGLEKWRWVPDY